jgi:hypothetical protein
VKICDYDKVRPVPIIQFSTKTANRNVLVASVLRALMKVPETRMTRSVRRNSERTEQARPPNHRLCATDRHRHSSQGFSMRQDTVGSNEAHCHRQQKVTPRSGAGVLAMEDQRTDIQRR